MSIIPIEVFFLQEMQEQENSDLLGEPDSEEYNDNSLEDLEEMLQKAIDNEDYEKASRLRDEINKRKR